MKRYKKIILIIAGIIILFNFYPFTAILEIAFEVKHYRYSNYNGSLTFSEFKGHRFDMLKHRHESCLLARPDLKDKNLYRLFTKNPLAFWRWRLYFFDERYKLPYKNWDEIKKIREKEKIMAITGCTIGF